jgi:hypothetical protein
VPDALQEDPAQEDVTTRTLHVGPTKITPAPAPYARMPSVQADPNVDYKILTVTADPQVDYKITVVGPEAGSARGSRLRPGGDAPPEEDPGPPTGSGP